MRGVCGAVKQITHFFIGPATACTILNPSALTDVQRPCQLRFPWYLSTGANIDRYDFGRDGRLLGKRDAFTTAGEADITLRVVERSRFELWSTGGCVENAHLYPTGGDYSHDEIAAASRRTEEQHR